MTNDLTLSRRAVACPGWRWLAGMLARGESVGPRGGYSRVRVEGLLSSGPPKVVDFHGRRVPAHYVLGGDESSVLPDLTDPCTLGGLEALVRDRWGDDVYLRPLHTHAHYNGPGADLMPVVWWALARGNDMLTVPRDPDGTGTRRLAGPTRATALVAALEAP
jgi:hypothetical protein